MNLTTKYRPKTFDEMYGQEMLVGTNGLLRQMIATNNLHSSIFFGPPGCGKTTAAFILATQANCPFLNLNATSTSLTEVRKAISVAQGPEKNTVLLYLDEIQYFNKKQQQTLLQYIESEEIILIGATTENPYHSCYDALLSRCVVLEFKPLNVTALSDCIKDIADKESRTIDNQAVKIIAENSAGDMRRAIMQLSIAFLQCTGNITADDIKQSIPTTRMSGFDIDGDQHYSLISGLQKSIRGSDPNAAIFYLARLLEGGDILSPCRRLLVIAHEDIGLARPNAANYVLACVETAERLGLPEASKPLTNAVLYLAMAPKACSCETTYNAVLEDIHAGRGNIIPPYLRNACSPGYLYPHNYPDHWIKQQYLPDDLADKVYYHPGDNTFEQQAAEYWKNIIKERTK